MRAQCICGDADGVLVAAQEALGAVDRVEHPRTPRRRPAVRGATQPQVERGAPGARMHMRMRMHMYVHTHAHACTHTHMACTLHMACTWRAHAARFQEVRGARGRLRAHPHAFEELRVDAVRSAARVARGRGDHSSARRGVRGEQVRRRLLGNEAVLLARRLRVMDYW